jgi:hypothetical protein
MDKTEKSKEQESGNRKTIYTAILCCIIGAACMYWSVLLFLVYAPFFLIAFVLGIIILVKGRVLIGLAISLIASIMPGLLFVILVVLPNENKIEDFVGDWRGKIGKTALVMDQNTVIGENITTPKFELKVISTKTSRFVGSVFRHIKPSSGAIYFTVTWQYKNISNKPILPRLKPVITLVSPRGDSYHVDIPASRTISRNELIKGVTANSINPGIIIKRTDVFEVDKKTAKENGWEAIIKADELVGVRFD